MTGKSHTAMGVGTAIVCTSYLVKTTGDYSHLLSLPMVPFFCVIVDVDIDGSKYGALRTRIMNYAKPIMFFGVIGLAIFNCFQMYLKEKYQSLFIFATAFLATLIIFVNASKIPVLKEHVRFWTEHRGITHWIGIPIIMSYLFKNLVDDIPPILYLWEAFIYGYGTHLFGDFLNDKGIPFGYPLTTRRFGLGIVKYAGPMEYIVAGLWFAACCYFAVYIWR